MATEKQIAANRRNALRSTGPRTPEGKLSLHRTPSNTISAAAASSWPSECPERYEAFRQHFYDDYMPATATETALVDIMATALWRLDRVDGFEAMIIDHESRHGNFADNGILGQSEPEPRRRVRPHVRNVETARSPPSAPVQRRPRSPRSG